MGLFFSLAVTICAYVIGKGLKREDNRDVGREYYRKNGHFADQAPEIGRSGVRLSRRGGLPLGRPFRIR